MCKCIHQLVKKSSIAYIVGLKRYHVQVSKGKRMLKSYVSKTDSLLACLNRTQGASHTVTDHHITAGVNLIYRVGVGHIT